MSEHIPAAPVPATPGPIVRLGTTEDVAGVLLLESRYYIGNLTPEQQENGFVAVLQPDGWFAQIAASGGLHVAVDDQNAVVGFIVVAPPQCTAHTALPPIVAKMVALADTLDYHGRRVSSYRYALRGPVCIDERYRGRGLYEAFNAGTNAAYEDTYEIGILFVSTHNPRSLRTTTTKLKATPLATFSVDGASYVFLAYDFSGSKTSANK